MTLLEGEYFIVPPEKEPTEQQARDAADAHYSNWLKKHPTMFKEKYRASFIEEEWEGHLKSLRADAGEPLPTVDYANNLSKYGDLMTVEEFRESVKCGGFIDYDGLCTPVKDGKETWFTIYPSRQHLIPLDATHVIWFNR